MNAYEIFARNAHMVPARPAQTGQSLTSDVAAGIYRSIGAIERLARRFSIKG